MDDDFAAELAAELFDLMHDTADPGASLLMQQAVVDMAWPSK